MTDYYDLKEKTAERLMLYRFMLGNLSSISGTYPT